MTEQENMVQSIGKMKDELYEIKIKELNDNHKTKIDSLTNELNDINVKLEDYQKNNTLFESIKYDLINFDKIDELLSDLERRGESWKFSHKDEFGTTVINSADNMNIETYKGYKFIHQLVFQLKDQFVHYESEKKRVLNVADCNINEEIKVQNLLLQKNQNKLRSDFEWATRQYANFKLQSEKYEEELNNYKETDYKDKYEKLVETSKDKLLKAKNEYRISNSKELKECREISHQKTLKIGELKKEVLNHSTYGTVCYIITIIVGIAIGYFIH